MEILSFSEFRKLSSQGNLVPVLAKISVDTETPVSAFLKMTEGPYRFLLESLEGGERWGRYSFLGSEPALVLRAQEDKIEIDRKPQAKGSQKKSSVETHQGKCLDAIREILAPFHPVKAQDLPRFTGGLVGYLGYDLVRQMERIPNLGRSGLPLFDAQLMLQDSIIAFDNVNHQLEIVVMVHLNGKKKLRPSYEAAVKRIKNLVRRLNQPLPKLKNSRLPLRAKSNTKKEDFYQKVKKAKAYIRSGDIFQVQISQRWQADFNGSPFQVYRQLRQINPSPYLFYLEFGDQVLSGSSPEVMVRLEDKKITLRPIAGTRRRGRDAADEIKMEQEMIHDPKEIAEHVMLVDLGRNDVGRVAQVGSVKVSELMVVEKYSHVMHMVSNVEGKIKNGLSAVDVLQAGFPAGTLTGAPKIRAMEIIEELENEKRGPYGGCAGYFDFYGNLDTAITIRSLAFNKNKVWFQSAGGVVLDSKPELEYLETNNKAKAVLEALKRCS